jgi:SAM-dependent methyltransferase
MLADVKAGLDSIAFNVPLVLNSTQAADMNCSQVNLAAACDALIESKSNKGLFIQGFNDWKRISKEYFYVEAIRASSSCTNEEAPKAIALMEFILADQIGPEIKALADFVLGRKYSPLQPLKAYHLCKEAFEVNPNLCKNITQPNSPVNNYIYHKTDEIYFDRCPICHGNGTPYYCAMPLFMADFSPIFSPVKLWMRCESCGQLYTFNFVNDASLTLADEKAPGSDIYIQPVLKHLPVFGEVINRIQSYTDGNRLLEVGIGGGELIAAALEFGYRVEAVEIVETRAQRISKMLDVPVTVADYIKFDTKNKYDVITMGDVIEHVFDPTAAIRKTYDLLEDDGVLWISTPNFNSGFSRIMKFDDPMWNEPTHVTYFSYDGFRKLLFENGFEILNYKISNRYNGSMEIIAKKHK